MIEYAYVCSYYNGQNMKYILDELYEIGMSDDRIFYDAKKSKKENYSRLLELLLPGDTLFIPSIIHLGDKYDEIMEQWKIITKEKYVNIVVLDMPLLDTRKDSLISISDVVIQVLLYLNQKERYINVKRQKEGIDAARKRGVHIGRQAMELPDNFKEVVRQWRDKKITAKSAAKILGVSRTYLYQKVKELGL